MAGPRWVRLDADYFTNPKALAVGKDGRALHLASVCWVAAQLTDGQIPTTSVHALLSVAGVRTPIVDRVIAAGLWIPNGDGYELHDFLVMNPELSRAEVEKSRARWREKQRAYRASKRSQPDELSL